MIGLMDYHLVNLKSILFIILRNISRDFSDGILMAEIIQHFYPKIV